MCLEINEKEKNVPHKDGNIRYKVVLKAKNGDLSAPFRGNLYNKTDWNIMSFPASNTNFRPDDHGFHVFVNSQAAVGVTRGCDDVIAKKVEVRGFLHRGTWSNKKSETWAMFRFID